MKSKLFALFCAVLLLLTGCVPKPKDDFSDYELVEPPVVEGVTAHTEFTEYDGNVEKLCVIVTNDSDEYFLCGEFFWLDKKVSNEWKRIKTGGFDTLLGSDVLPHDTGSIQVRLKDFAKLPLLPGHYRVWVGSFDPAEVKYHRLVPAEFDVK